MLKTEGLGENQIAYMEHIKIRSCHMSFIFIPKRLIWKSRQCAHIHSQIMHYHTGNVSKNPDNLQKAKQFALRFYEQKATNSSWRNLSIENDEIIILYAQKAWNLCYVFLHTKSHTPWVTQLFMELLKLADRGVFLYTKNNALFGKSLCAKNNTLCVTLLYTKSKTLCVTFIYENKCTYRLRFYI